MLDDLTEGGDRIVPGVIELSLFALLGLGVIIHHNFDCCLDGGEAAWACSRKGSTTMLSSHSDAVYSSLSHRCVLR